MARNKQTLEQIAKDYDMPLWIVEKANNKNEYTLHQQLEKILKERRNE